MKCWRRRSSSSWKVAKQVDRQVIFWIRETRSLYMGALAQLWIVLAILCIHYLETECQIKDGKLCSPKPLAFDR